MLGFIDSIGQFFRVQVVQDIFGIVGVEEERVEDMRVKIGFKRLQLVIKKYRSNEVYLVKCKCIQKELSCPAHVTKETHITYKVQIKHLKYFVNPIENLVFFV